MSISKIFDEFTINLRMSDNTISKVRNRFRSITKRINMDYYNTNHEFNNTFYVGSYGRGTDIFASDIDIVAILPVKKYYQYDDHIYNGQSALIQEVKNILKNTYPTSHIKGDGQVICINFRDGIKYEILPAFNHKDGKSFIYPDTHNGGSWKVTNPRQEIKTINKYNKELNKNLKRLCRMTRAWKEQCNVEISGYLIDTLAYRFLKDYKYNDESYLYYDWITRDFFKYLSDCDKQQPYWIVPGSKNRIYENGKFQYKSKIAYNNSVKAEEFYAMERLYSAKLKWREIYGSQFPS